MKQLCSALMLMGLLGAATPHLRADDTAQQRFASANQLFEKGELGEAFEIYKGLAQQGFGGVSLYYNLGNLLYRQGDRGRAILWYERALTLAPRDADTRFNLALARAHLKDADDSWFERMIYSLSANEIAVAFTLIAWIFFLTLSAMLLKKFEWTGWPLVTLWAAGFFLVIAGGWLGAHAALSQRPVAVVVRAPGEVRNGPGVDYAVGFTVPEGSKVVILNRRPDWIQVGLVKQGLKGWMPAADIEQIRINSASLG